MIDYEIAGFVLVALAIGTLAGHALGYSRALDAVRRRRNVSHIMARGPRYRRTGADVGRPE